MGTTPIRSRLAPLLALGLAACAPAAEVDGITLAMDDPSGLLARAEAARLLVMPASGWRCTDGGGVEPPVGDDFAVEPERAAAAIDLPVGMPTAQSPAIVLAEGDYRVVVQARGDEPLSGRRDVVIGQGCADATVTGGETTMVRIALHAVVPEGRCGDGGLDPDELCDDGNTADGDGCSASCRTEPLRASVGVGGDTSGVQDQPAAAWAPGQRLVVAYRGRPEGSAPDVFLRILSEEAEPLSSPSALAVGLVGDRISGEQLLPAVAVASGSALLAFQDVRSALAQGGDVRVRRFETASGAADPPGTMLPRGVSSFLHENSAGLQARPTAAAAPDGRVLVVFEDDTSPSGLSARLVPAGSGTPEGTDAWAVGDGAAEAGTSPALAAVDGGFLLAFVAGADLWVQRLDAQGMPQGPAAAVLSGTEAEGPQAEPAIAALQGPDGPLALLAWEERGPRGDGDGATVRALLLDGQGAPLGEPFVVPTTAAGDQVQPAVAALAFERGGTIFRRFVVAWRSGERLLARLFDEQGLPATYRTVPPSASELLVAEGVRDAPAIAAGGPADRPAWAAAWSDGDDVWVRRLPLP